MAKPFPPIPVAPAWKMVLVRMFGKRYVQSSADGCISYYVWRGRTYIDDIETFIL